VSGNPSGERRKALKATVTDLRSEPVIFHKHVSFWLLYFELGIWTIIKGAVL
jgi:hypothetical protein